MSKTLNSVCRLSARKITTATAVVLLSIVGDAAADENVDQQGLKFSKPEVTLKVGAKMNFHNHDDVTHNIMVIDSEDEPEDEGTQKPGEVITKQFTEAGSFQVRCAIHPKMKMAITVEK